MITLLAALAIQTAPLPPPSIDSVGRVPYVITAPLSETITPAELPKLEELPVVEPVHQVTRTAYLDPTNTYPSAPYQCTRYAKDRRPDIPNYLGNANLWFDKLAALGWAVGYEPRVGAIAQSIASTHVAYVEQVDGSRIYISERNFDYNGSYNERWVNAGEWKYIY